jgi:competence protein ComEA
MKKQNAGWTGWRRRVFALTVLSALAAAAPLASAAPPSADERPAVVNLNTATAGELEALPGIGAKKAEAIVEARKARGGFKSVDELVDVRGIGPAQMEKLRPHLRVSSDTASSATAKP